MGFNVNLDGPGRTQGVNSTPSGGNRAQAPAENTSGAATTETDETDYDIDMSNTNIDIKTTDWPKPTKDGKFTYEVNGHVLRFNTQADLKKFTQLADEYKRQSSVQVGQQASANSQAFVKAFDKFVTDAAKEFGDFKKDAKSGFDDFRANAMKDLHNFDW
jgi:hypothetical protein